MIKQFLAVAAGLFTLAAVPASAADLPLKAVAPVSVWSWTGFYAGVNVGGGMANTHFDDPCFT